MRCLKVFKFIHNIKINLHYYNTTINDFDDFLILHYLFSQLQISNYLFYKIFNFNIFKLCKRYDKNTFINNKTILSCNIINRFNFFYENKLCLGLIKRNKLYWTNFSYNPMKFFNVIKNNFAPFKSNLNEKNLQKSDILNRYVIFKKKNGFVKRKDKRTYNVAVKINFLRNARYINNFFDNLSFSDRLNNVQKESLHENEFSKIYELKRKNYKIIKLNRVLLTDSLNLKTHRQTKLTKLFSKNLKKSTSKVVKSLELSLSTLLVKCKFVFTVDESIFFIKNNLVFVNGVCINNPFYLIKNNNIVSILFSPKYFIFFKTNLNSKLRLTFFVGYRLWRFNRFKTNFYKQSPLNLPNWINKLSSAYNDVPSNAEIDYTTLSFVLLSRQSFSENNFWSNINISMFRLYNWKYIN